MGDLTPCQIVFRGARMKRRCMDLPVPKVLVYRKLDCKAHHCNFTLLHPTVRKAISGDTSAKASVAIKMYGGKSISLSIYSFDPCSLQRLLSRGWQKSLQFFLFRPSPLSLNFSFTLINLRH